MRQEFTQDDSGRQRYSKKWAASRYRDTDQETARESEQPAASATT